MVTEDKKREYIRRLILSRMRLLCSNGFFGLLLMHAEFTLDEELETAATDGQKIYFSPKFMDELSDSELDFVLMHEIMHVALGHCLRTGDRDHELFNIACDIVVNSNILKSNGNDLSTITIKKYGESMHLAPDGKEGAIYTVEEVYEQFNRRINRILKAKSSSANGNGSKTNQNGKSNGKNGASGVSWDSHDKWGTLDDDQLLEKQGVWDKWIKDAAQAIDARKKATGIGNIPLLVERKLGELKQSQTDWRTVLNEFVHEEVVDYSFSPPDKRFSDSPFFLPDFNDTDIAIENVLFMIDTSASIDQEMMTQAYSEIKGAIDQFDGRLKGLLGFFDYNVVPPLPFEDEQSLKVIKPKGGGGTSFYNIFEYVNKNMQDTSIASIIILTDGYAQFPPEAMTNGIPVLWVINNDNVLPPWGKVTRIKQNKKD